MKLLGDSRFDFNYYNGKNHFSKECMLKNRQVKKNETYYVEKLKQIKELKENTKYMSLIVMNDECEGTQLVFSKV